MATKKKTKTFLEMANEYDEQSGRAFTSNYGRTKSGSNSFFEMAAEWDRQSENTRKINSYNSLLNNYNNLVKSYYQKSDNYNKEGPYHSNSAEFRQEMDTSRYEIYDVAEKLKSELKANENEFGSDYVKEILSQLQTDKKNIGSIMISAERSDVFSSKWKNADEYNKDVRESSYYEKYKDMSAVDQETARNKLNTTIRRASNNGDTEAEKAAREELDFLETYGSTGSQIAGAQNKYYDLTNRINDIDAEIEKSQKNRLSELEAEKKELEEQRAYYAQLMSGKDTYSAEYEDKYNGATEKNESESIEELQNRRSYLQRLISYKQGEIRSDGSDRVREALQFAENIENPGILLDNTESEGASVGEAAVSTELYNELHDLESELKSVEKELDYLYKFGGKDAQYIGRQAWLTDKQRELNNPNISSEKRAAIQNEINMYQRSEQGKADEYYKVTKADDFEEKAAVGAAIENPTIEEISAYETALDPVHQQDGADYWNNVFSNAPKVTNKLEFYFSNRDHAIGHHLDSYVSPVEGYQDAMKGASRNWDYFEENERKTYNYILATEGEEAADAYLDSMQVILDRRANEASQKNIAENVNKPGIEGVINRVGYSIASVPLNVFGGAIALLDDAASAIRGEYNPYSPGHAMMLTGQNARNAVAQKFAEDSPLEIMGQNVAGQIYNALMSSADSVLGAATMGRMYTIVMGSSAASTHARELYEKGATGSQIFFGSLTAGVAEALFEYVSIDKLLTERNIESIMQAVKAILVQSGVEATEEIFTDVSNFITDNIVMGVNSDYEQAAAEYEQKGYSRSDALRMALIDAVKETAWSGISGALSGGFSSTVFTGAQAYGNYKTGEAIRSAGNENAVISAAQSEYAGEEANAIAEKINKKGAATNMQLGALKTAIQQGAIKSYDDLVSEFADAGDIKADLVESGMDEKAASKKANTISKIIKGENVSARAEAEIRNDPIARDVISNYEQTINLVTALSGIDSVYNTASESTKDRKSKYSKKKTVWDEPERLDVSEGENEGKTILKDTGEEIGNYEIVDTDDGAIALKLDNGATVDIGDVSFASNKEAAMIEMFSDAGASAETVNALMKSYDENAGVAHGVWTKAITDVYDYGVIGASKQYMQNGAQFIDSLTDEQINLAYERGRADRAARVEARKKLIKGLRAGVKVNRKTGTRLSDDAITNKEFQKINEKGGTQKDRKLASMKLVHNLAKALGVRVTFYASELASDGKRYYIDENGNRKLAPNGKYSANGEIFIDINSGNAGEGTIIYTLAHELTHFIKDWSPEKFKVLSEMLLEKYAEKGYSLTGLVDMQIENAKKEGRKISRDVALEEVVADSCETFLTDKNVLQTLQEIKQKDTSLFGKIKEFFSKAIKALEKVIGLYDGVETNSRDGKIVAEWKEELSDLKRIYAEGLADASDNYSYSKQKNNTSEGVRYESRYFVEDKYYQRKIDEWESLNRGEYIKVGTINKGSALNNIGLPIGNLYFDVSKIKDEMEKHEDHLSTDIMKKIPQLLDNPIAITEYKPGQDTNTVSVYGNLYYKGTPITVGIVAVKNRAGILITKVRTIHARGNLKNQITDKSILFLNENKKETDKWFQAQGHRVPMGGTKYGFIRSIQLKYDSVNTFDKNSSPSDENSSERHSSRAQLDSDYMKAVESGDMKTAQKMVDEAAKAAGYTVKYMYHGSHSKFNVFDIKKARYNGFYGKGFYFSDSKVNAGVYGETYRVYLKTLNPLEPGKSSVTKTQLKKYLQAVSENEDYDIYNYGTTNINDIADNIYKNDAFAVIQDVNATAIGDFSEAIKLYNEVNGTSYDSIITPTETVVYNNTQIKLSDPVTYDDNSNVIPLSERFNENNEDIRFSSRSSNIYDEVGELERLRKENAELQDDVEGLKQLIKLQKTVTKGTMKTQTAVEHAAKELMEKYGVKNNKDNLASLMNQLSAFYTATATTENVGDLSWDDVQNQLEPVARWIVDNGTVSTAYPGLELSESEKAALNDYFETELLRDAVQSIYDTYWRATTLYTTADKHGMEIDALKAEHKKAMSKLRADKNARIETIKAEDKEYYQEMISRLREKKNAQIDETKKHAAEMRLKGIENRKQTQLRNKIRKLADEMSRSLLKPTEMNYVPQSLVRATSEALKELTYALDTGTSANRTQILFSLIEEYESIKDKNQYAGAYDSDIMEMLRELPEILDKPLTEMSSYELTNVYNTFKGLQHTIRESVRMTASQINQTSYEFAADAIKETRAVKPSRSNVWNRYILTQLRPETAFDTFGGHAKDNHYLQLYDMLNQGQHDMLTFEMEANRIFSDLIGDKKGMKKLYSTKDKDLVDIGLKDDNGNTVKITHGMLCELYKLLLNPDSARHVAIGGLHVPDLGRYYKGKDNAYGVGSVLVHGTVKSVSESQRRIDELTSQINEARKAKNRSKVEELKRTREVLQTDLYQIVDQYTNNLRSRVERAMSDFDKKWAEASHEFFDGYSKEKLNETTMKRYGFEKATVDYYYPVNTDNNFHKSKDNDTAKPMTLDGVGFMKERIVGASNPIYLGDISFTVTQQIAKSARYYGLAVPLWNLSKVLDVQLPNYADSVQLALKQTFDGRAWDYISDLRQDLAGSRTTIEDVFAKLRGNMAQSSLTLNARVSLVQSASYPTAAAEIGFEPLIKALKSIKRNAMFSKEERAIIESVSPLLSKRLQGFLDADIGDAKSLLSPKKRAFKKVKWLMGWIEAVDGFTVAQLWLASKEYVKKHNPELAVDSKEYLQAVGIKFNEVVEKTQPNYTTLQRPDLLRTNNPMLRSLAMFYTQRLQNFNIVFESAARLTKYRSDYKNGINGVTQADVKEAGARFAKAITSQVIASMTIAVFQALADGLLHKWDDYRDEEGEINLASFIKGFLINWTESLAGNMFLGAELYSIIKFIIDKACGNDAYISDALTVGGVDSVNSLISSALGIFSSARSIIQKAGSDEEITRQDIEKPVRSFANSLGQVIGIPINNFGKILDAFYNWANDINNGEFMESGYDRSSKEYSSALYDAMLADDEEKIEKYKKYYKDSDAMHAAIRSQLRKKDERIKEAGQKLFDRDVTGAKEIEREIIDEGHFSQSDILAAVNSELNVLKTKQEEEEAEKEKQEEIENGTYKEWWEKEPDGKTEEGSFYSASDLNLALEGNDLNAVKEALKELRENKMAEGKTEKEADGEIRQAVTYYWKPKYQKAVEKKDTVALSKVYSVMEATKLYGSNVKDYASKYWTDTDK